MVTLLSLLPRTLTTFLFALTALLRFYGNTESIPIRFIPLTFLQWSFWAFIAATTTLVVNLGLEWNTGHRSRYREAEERAQAEEERGRAAYRAYLQSRFAILRIRYLLEASEQNRGALRNFLALLEEYGEL